MRLLLPVAIYLLLCRQRGAIYFTTTLEPAMAGAAFSETMTRDAALLRKLSSYSRLVSWEVTSDRETR